MTHLLTPVLTMLSPRRLPHGSRPLEPPFDSTRSARTLRSRILRWTAATAAAAAAVAATPTRARGGESPALPDAAAVAGTHVQKDTSTAPTNCEPLPPFTGGKDALTAAAKALVARGKQFPIGGPEHTDVKIEVMSLLVRAGDLEMCKLLRRTRETMSVSERQAHAIACVQTQFCAPMTLPNGCPAGMRNEGPEGCAPIRSCTAAGAGAQAAACKAGDASCCAPALLLLEIADVQAGMPTPESLATRRSLARLGCGAGHAELCLEAAALGVGAPESQRQRACTLGHVESCRPPKSGP